MYKPDYAITKDKLDLIIYDLASGEGNIKERIITVFTERSPLMPEDFLVEFQDEWISIDSLLTEKGCTPYSNAYQNTLRNKRKSTCSKLVIRISNLIIRLENWLKNQGYN